ncbi:MAG: RIP metalloprotease RseP [Bacteroidales bacterium]|nr:RIP metalloprotease RseP [Bacteroidales bacterium]
MGIATQILGLILSLSLLVIVHELGHYTFARIFKTRVEKFYIFFNPGFSLMRMKKFNGKMHFSFFSTKSPEEWQDYPDSTEWGVGWLPLGGYCSIAGMVDETKTANDLPSDPQPWEFRSKPAWQRFFIILGGVLVNFITALILYAVILFTWGEKFIPLKNATYGMHFSEVALNVGFQNGDKIISIDGKETRDASAFITEVVIDGAKTVQVERDNHVVDVAIPADFGKQVIAQASNKVPICQFEMPFVIDSVMADYPAADAGLQKGDVLVGVDSETVFSFFDFQNLFLEHSGDSVMLSFMRSDSTVNTAMIRISPDGVIGVIPQSPLAFLETETVEYGFWEAIPNGIAMGWNKLVAYVKQFKFVFSKEGATQLGGFGTLGSIFPKEWNWELFWSMTAFLSLALAFMNFLPIPALDGGYILFILVEIITRKKPSDKFLGYANTVGFILLLALLIWANGLDILRAFK